MARVAHHMPAASERVALLVHQLRVAAGAHELARLGALRSGELDGKELLELEHLLAHGVHRHEVGCSRVFAPLAGRLVHRPEAGHAGHLLVKVAKHSFARPLRLGLLPLRPLLLLPHQTAARRSALRVRCAREHGMRLWQSRAVQRLQLCLLLRLLSSLLLHPRVGSLVLRSLCGGLGALDSLLLGQQVLQDASLAVDHPVLARHGVLSRMQAQSAVPKRAGVVFAESHTLCAISHPFLLLIREER
mmetsp:Transcript_11310/g.36130  ORF Transcript_11310/g.36130 Transcript_11310/m.36130 type:complete len:246 (+) Transcript_11310:1550-2287(+)